MWWWNRETRWMTLWPRGHHLDLAMASITDSVDACTQHPCLASSPNPSFNFSSRRQSSGSPYSLLIHYFGSPTVHICNRIAYTPSAADKITYIHTQVSVQTMEAKRAFTSATRTFSSSALRERLTSLTTTPLKPVAKLHANIACVFASPFRLIFAYLDYTG